MQEAVPEGAGSMLAVMGLNLNELEKLIKQLNSNLGICEVANDNSEGQIILSGNLEAINEINKILSFKKRSIFSVRLFHCSLMKTAAANGKKNKVLHSEAPCKQLPMLHREFKTQLKIYW